MLTFSKSMASLQADRERVLAEHKELESRHRELGELRDRQAGEGVEETTQLREQLRELQARMDDTNSENAKLSAQLVRYREDLNQVITMKDCQHKQVLSSHVERVRALEGEKAEVREQLGEAESREQQLTQLLESVTGEKESLSGQLASLEGTVLELRQEVESLTGGGPLRVLQDQLEGKSAEAEELRGGLARAVTERDEARSKLQAAEARHMEELRRQERDTGIMRNETETAEERVAELARDLLEIEERLRQVMEEREGLRAQNQAFGKAMGSLQHSRDQLLAQLEEGSNKDAEARCRALEEDKAGLTAQLDGFARTVMALQGERDRLSDQLARGWRIQEARQGASPGTVSSPPTTTAAEAQSLRKALAALQDDRDRLLKELRQLRAERVRAGEESELRAQLRQLEAQLEEQRECRERADQDNADHHRQLQQFRDEKQVLEQQMERYLVTMSDKDREISELQAHSHTQQVEVERLETERSGLTSQLNACLTELHHRELRIQHLNSKMAQVYEERNTLAAQARRNGQHQRDTQQQLNQLQAQLHTAPGKSESSVDTAPGGPQEIRGPELESGQTECGDLKLRLAEARRLQERAEGDVERMRLILAEEQEKRLGTEEALLASQQQLRSAELSEWVNAQEEHAMLIELPHTTTSSRTRSSSGTRCLRSLCFPRSRNKALIPLSPYGIPHWTAQQDSLRPTCSG
uniref:Golgin B1 n=1 Tax=Callorhinchus milii TaxID=7868 RepID=A0A4W3HH96_CALMI